jgi:hypothetical protein
MVTLVEWCDGAWWAVTGAGRELLPFRADADVADVVRYVRFYGGIVVMRATCGGMARFW